MIENIIAIQNHLYQSVAANAKETTVNQKHRNFVSLNKDIEMETLKIEVLNPKAKTLLKGLADLNLINIRKSKASDNYYLKFLERLRKNSDETPSLTEIQKEVRAVRGKKYGR